MFSEVATVLSAQNSQSDAIKGIAEQAFQMMSRSDEHSAFGEHIAAELRSLPGNDSNTLKSRLARGSRK